MHKRYINFHKCTKEEFPMLVSTGTLSFPAFKVAEIQSQAIIEARYLADIIQLIKGDPYQDTILLMVERIEVEVPNINSNPISWGQIAYDLSEIFKIPTDTKAYYDVSHQVVYYTFLLDGIKWIVNQNHLAYAEVFDC